jgi:hypothetical protein
MKWIRERDALIAQTMAFVQSVTGKTNAPGRTETADPMPATTVEVSTFVAIQETVERTIERTVEPPSEQTVQIDQPAASPPKPYQVAPPRATGDFRSEIQSRVASFRKHQERFEREREEYCAATLAKARAAIGDNPPRWPTGK